jgi:hypothetical protein
VIQRRRQSTDSAHVRRHFLLPPRTCMLLYLLAQVQHVYCTYIAYQNVFAFLGHSAKPKCCPSLFKVASEHNANPLGRAPMHVLRQRR